MRVLVFLGLLGIQQAVPSSLVVSLLVTALAAGAGTWAIAALRP